MSPFLLKRLSDESLGSRLASGEAAAFDELYRRYVHRLAAYGSHLLGDAAAGDDVAQSALLKAYGALRDGRVPEKMRPWLYRIAHNTAIDLAVRRRELPSDDVPELAARDTEPLAGALVTALTALPERQRRVYVLRELHGMRIAETASELGLTGAQVEQALFAARNRLAELLVFGDRLDCATVQRLAAGPLDLEERRALKTHLRSCAECRRAAGVRARATAWLPGPSFEWLRGLLVGGAAPAAAKVGAVVATATIAGSVPLAARDVLPHRGPAPVSHHRARPTPVVHPPSSEAARPVVFTLAAHVATPSKPAPRRRAPVEVEHHAAASPEHETVAARSDGHDGGGDTGAKATEVAGSSSGESGGGGDRPAAVTEGTVRTTDGHEGSGSPENTTTTTATSGDGGSGSGDSGSSGDGREPAVTTVPAVSTVPTTTTSTSSDGGSDGSDGSGSGGGGDGGN